MAGYPAYLSAYHGLAAVAAPVSFTSAWDGLRPSAGMDLPWSSTLWPRGLRGCNQTYPPWQPGWGETPFGFCHVLPGAFRSGTPADLPQLRLVAILLYFMDDLPGSSYHSLLLGLLVFMSLFLSSLSTQPWSRIHDVLVVSSSSLLRDVSPGFWTRKFMES